MKRRSRKRRLRNYLWFQTYGTAETVPCHWCRKLLRFDDTTLDHVPPLAEGGTWLQAVLACYDCNQKRNREQQARAKAGRKTVHPSPSA